MVGFFASHLVTIQEDQVQISVTPGGDAAVDFGSQILRFDRRGIKNEQPLAPFQFFDAFQVCSRSISIFSRARPPCSRSKV